MIEFGDVLSLENERSYVVGGLCEYKSEKYAYLVNEQDEKDMKLAKINAEGTALSIVTDDETIQEIIPIILSGNDFNINN